MSTREQLLKRVAELEPERFAAQGYAVRIDASYEARGIDIDDGITGVAWPATTPGIILAATIEGIEAHGWTLSVHTATTTRTAESDEIIYRGYGATIFEEGLNERGYVGGYDESHPTVVDALLAAYVKALEASVNA